MKDGTCKVKVFDIHQSPFIHAMQHANLPSHSPLRGAGKTVNVRAKRHPRYPLDPDQRMGLPSGFGNLATLKHGLGYGQTDGHAPNRVIVQAQDQVGEIRDTTVYVGLCSGNMLAPGLISPTPAMQEKREVFGTWYHESWYYVTVDCPHFQLFCVDLEVYAHDTSESVCTVPFVPMERRDSVTSAKAYIRKVHPDLMPLMLQAEVIWQDYAQMELGQGQTP